MKQQKTVLELVTGSIPIYSEIHSCFILRCVDVLCERGSSLYIILFGTPKDCYTIFYRVICIFFSPSFLFYPLLRRKVRYIFFFARIVFIYFISCTFDSIICTSCSFLFLRHSMLYTFISAIYTTLFIFAFAFCYYFMPCAFVSIIFTCAHFHFRNSIL